MKLKPCPFCGGEAKRVITDYDGEFIECTKCQASSVMMNPEMGDVTGLIMERWNLRTIESELLSALRAAYISGNRDGWQDGPTTDEAMKQALDALMNAGCKIGTDGRIL